jgi:uncharacterized protein (DUF433 family)
VARHSDSWFREAERKDFPGTYTVRDAAVLLRATTPPEGVTELEGWQRNPRRFIKPSSRHLYTWIRLGLQWDQPVKVSSKDRVITFEDLIRLRMYTILRSRGFSFRAIQEAEKRARTMVEHPQPFVTEPLWTTGSHIFMRVSELLVSLNSGGQTGMDFLWQYLDPASPHHGITFGRHAAATRWAPASGVVIDPQVQFGEPCIEGTRIATETVWSFYSAGDSLDVLSAGYGVSPIEIEAAIDWERLRAAAA